MKIDMTKKILLLLAIVFLSALSQVVAQNAVGDWRIHTSFVGNSVTSVAEGKNFVYYLAGANLFRLDKETSENEALSIVNDLSDMGIKQIYYNSDRDYLVVVYTNANIDVIQSEGQVVNMSEVKDAVLTTSKNINDVTFADGLIYLATDFGYAVIDDSKFVFKESHLYGKPIITAARLGDQLLLSTADGIYYGDADQYHEQLSSFSLNKAMAGSRIFPLKQEGKFLRVTSKTRLVTMTTSADGNVSFNEQEIIQYTPTLMQNTVGGYLLNVPSAGKCYKINDDGEVVEVMESTELCSAHPGGNGKPWACGADGLHQLGEENYYKPNALSFAAPFWMTYNKAKDLLYVSSSTANAFFSNTSPTAVNTYDGTRWTDVTPEGAPVHGSYWIEFLPDAPDTYFLGTWRNGLLKVVNDQIVATYDSINSPLKKQYSMRPVTSIDRNGNVWVAQPYENKDNTVMVLPAASAKQNQAAKGDWVTISIDGISTGHTLRSSFLSTRNSGQDIKLFTDGDFEMPIFIWNSAGSLNSRPQQASFSRLLDQDGQYFSWTYIMCLAEDLNGLVWMGTTEGVVSFNPVQAFASDFKVNHIKVPRNDGTGMADYLLDGIQVNGIAVDGANRKWIATQTSGLFLVSADGSQIINRFNTTNSPLASNTVYKVCCDPNSNSVYITTPAGLYEYYSDSSPAEVSYDNIYAYPNPVRPEYSGNVTITGMMGGSLIKIADASGNVVRQLKSTGGMVTWDCCNQWGEPVKTGIYMVLCSRDGGSEAVVTKIAVIR